MLSPDVKRFACELLRTIGSTHAQSCLTAVLAGDGDYIASQRVDPKDYTDAKSYFLDAQASALLRKCSDLPTTIDRKAQALKSWKSGEYSCYKANERLAPYLEGLTHPSCEESVYQHIVGIRKIVMDVLGRAPSLDELVPKHGPGATFSDPSVRSTVADKMNARSSLTPGAFWFLLPWKGTAWGRKTPASRSPVYVRGNRFSTAPKDALKDRPIGAEPSINIFYQLALGKKIRSRLKNAGIDLDGGKEIHMRVACEASISGSLATLDLSNASDTVAYNLVRLLLPTTWFELLSELRSPFTQFSPSDGVGSKGGWWKLEKFSSMGNGFTFELETLLFYSIVKYVSTHLAAADQRVLVFGDDIICSTDIVRPVTSILNFLGFTLNAEKSFSSGPFRESCGGDYFNGQAVRPYFLKELPCEPQHFIAAANGLRAAIESSPCEFSLFRRAWFHLLDCLPVDIRRCRGPKSLGDLVVHDEESRWLTRQRSQSMYIRVYRPAIYRKVAYRLFDAEVVHACALLGLPWSRGFILPRDSVAGYKLGWMCAWGLNWLPVQELKEGRDSLPPFEFKALSVRYRVIGVRPRP